MTRFLSGLILALLACLPAAPARATPPAAPSSSAAPVRDAAPAAGIRHDDDPRQDEPRPRPRPGHHRERGNHGDLPRRPGGFGPMPVPAGVQVPDWSALTPEQKQQLAHLQATWDEMPASRRVRALERLERRARWEAMTPEERQRLREGARNFHDLPPELREKMRASLRATRALPDAERRRLFERWHALSPEQRRAWLEAGGPGLAPEP